MSNIQELWKTSWTEAVEGVDLTQARVGGRATKANPDKENADWWQTSGPEWLKSYIEWRKNNSGWKIWKTPDGTPAIELGLVVNIEGVEIKMVIDRVFDVNGELVVVDLKTSQRLPSNPLQLGFYKIGLEKQFGVPVNYGNYYMARQGGTGELIDLTGYTEEKISYMIKLFDKARQAGIFIPNTNSCNTFCGFTDVCEFYPGKLG